MARTGRRPGGTDTRGAILEAARIAFAETGYHGATIRGIAAAAGVDPALVHHYFGAKDDLFAAAIRLPLRPVQAAETILAGGADEVGERVARLFFSVWETPDSRDALLAMLRGAFVTEQAARSLQEFFESVLVERIAPTLDVPDPRLRMSLVASHMVGVAVLRYVVGFEVLRETSVEDLVSLIAPRLQSYVTG
ncbi:MAG: TetR/AcrR family transcriptional regulator [Actinomycetota bacterium]